jgi:ribokinase
LQTGLRGVVFNAGHAFGFGLQRNNGMAGDTGEIGSFDVIVCGSLHLDIMVHVPVLPRIDETAVGTAWKKHCGGKGGNQAVAAARMGARTAMIGQVGADEFGETLCTHLKTAGVDCSSITVDPQHGSGMSVAILQDDGDYGAVIVSGSNLNIQVENLAHHWKALGGAKVLVLQNEISHEVNMAAARLAQQHGAVVVYNAAPARAKLDDLLTSVDVLIVNRVEAEAMFGRSVQNRAAARAVLEARPLPCKTTMITLGGEGVVFKTVDTPVVEVWPKPVKVTSSHGAGDCFVGVLAARLAQGQSIENACRLANEAAAVFVSKSV